MKIFDIAALIIIAPLTLASSAFGLSVISHEKVINSRYAKEIGISVNVFVGSEECPGSQDVYISIPYIYKSTVLHSVMLTIQEDGRALLVTPLRTVSFEDYKGFSEFHGINMCLSEETTEKVELALFYGQGEITSYVLLLSIIDLMSED